MLTSSFSSPVVIFRPFWCCPFDLRRKTGTWSESRADGSKSAIRPAYPSVPRFNAERSEQDCRHARLTPKVISKITSFVDAVEPPLMPVFTDLRPINPPVHELILLLVVKCDNSDWSIWGSNVGRYGMKDFDEFVRTNLNNQEWFDVVGEIVKGSAKNITGSEELIPLGKIGDVSINASFNIACEMLHRYHDWANVD